MALTGTIIGVLALTETSTLGEANCHNIGTLASIERRYIGRQEAQTQAILAKGATFGISKEELPILIAASRASTARFLIELETLTHSNC
jgi:hypothetical protein